MRLHRCLVSGIIVLGLAGCGGESRDLFDFSGEDVSSASVGDRLKKYKSAFEERIEPYLHAQNVSSRPELITLVFFKSKRELRLYAGDKADGLKLIKTYAVLAASGVPGPKLQEGDLQVPEGIYRVAWLNPNSAYHLSLKVNYPNAADLRNARADGRARLGGDIMIHGKAASVGCIAIGDEPIEELFVLAGRTDYTNWKLILTPADLRTEPVALQPPYSDLKWIAERYQQIFDELAKLPEDSEVLKISNAN